MFYSKAASSMGEAPEKFREIGGHGENLISSAKNRLLIDKAGQGERTVLTASLVRPGRWAGGRRKGGWGGDAGGPMAGRGIGGSLNRKTNVDA